ncbi:asparagine synthase (glutamine-hydrolyzing) [Acetivibrio ethanolgignens]|uniref:asparagine synthase (glutamine-hydrolyzing) n=1 Tax=Acetivibrio ethanolgignens TaxID=290052 RepID=A0A0V8QBM0_9FIRM|nr:asparagine synthase (glutamine-hydrolyzing) [Acetivibrio ethanolgignens]KSV57979.1 asparagine synthetase B [Acetivibrio ethanolgignens]
MCGISGFCDFSGNLLNNREYHLQIAEKMGRRLLHRGPDDFGAYVSEHAAFSHARLAVMDPERGKQPMIKRREGYEYAIVYNGEIYNTRELRKDLEKEGFFFETTSDTEVVLAAYMVYGKRMIELLNGIYAFAIWDGYERCVFLGRDRFGVKPLFYTVKDGIFLFASELKGLLEHPRVEPVLNEYGICEIFGLGPARSPGCGVYQDIYEVPPGYMAYVDYSGCKLSRYFELEPGDNKENYENAVEHTREILFDAIERQMISDVPICTLLSGGLDSSVVSAVAARYLKKQGKRLDTYSFDYQDNTKNFKASSFQPEEDRPYVEKMVEAIGSRHRYLECGNEDLLEGLYEAVRAKDLPGMADVDSSLLRFARKIKENHTVCLSGECADEVFGGYPWFRDEQVYKNPVFPWSKNLELRKEVLSPELLRKAPVEDYVRCQYEKTMRRVPLTGEETEEEKRQKEISYLNTSWFMTTLLDRKDRMTMASGLEVRVPFADHRLISYLYRVPWKYKYHKGEVKSLLKDAASEVLPEAVLRRKKCPYPKTYDPAYEKALKIELIRLLERKEEPIGWILNREAVLGMLKQPSDYGRPWFGQLMAAPQMYAYFIQINTWLTEYKVDCSKL